MNGEQQHGADRPAMGLRGQTLGACALWVFLCGVYAWNVDRYFFVGDDAFISFRYAANLVAGHGLVWNPGEYVEGYTNFLWVLILALGMELGIGPEGLSCMLGIASGVGVLATLGIYSSRRLGVLHPLVWLPLFTLALSRSFTAWSTGGLATQFFTLLVLLAQIQFLRERRRTAGVPWLSSLLFAIATLTRPEGGLFTAVAGLFFALRVFQGREALRDLLLWCVPWFAIVGAHFGWRFAYYGAWLPNTFHAKVNGLWFEQAAHYFGIFHDDYKVGYYLPLILLGLLRTRGFAHAFFTMSIFTYCAYLYAIGGGRFEFRFLVVILPTLYWLIAEGLRVLLEAPGPARRGFGVLAIAAAAALLVTTHLGSISPAAKVDRYHIESIARTRDYAAGRAEQGKILRRYIDEGVLPTDLMLCVGGAGALPYYTGWPTLDFRGLNDPVIAHSPLDERGAIAHEHYATAAYMRERGVVVYDALNHLVHTGDVSRYRGHAAIRGNQTWKLRAVRLGEHTMVFSTLVPEAKFRHAFGDLEILF